MALHGDDNTSLDGNEESIMTLEKVQQATKTTILAYMNERTKEYEEYGLKGIELFEYWKADFENFDAAAYKKTTEGTRILRDFLRINGVYIPKNRKSIADNLIASSKTWTPWPVDSYISSDSQSHKSSFVKHQSVSTSQFDKAPPSIENIDLKPEKYDYQPDDSSHSRQTTARGTTGALVNLSKIYSQDHKYSGDGDSFDYKFGIFVDLCEKTDFPEDQYFKAFSTMLKGAALKHYYTSIKPNPLITTIKGLCENIRETFEGNEYKRSMLTKWNNTSLKSVMEKNPEKYVELCLQLLIEDLRTTQMALQSNFRDDTSFQNKLMTACQAHPACSIACSIPASSSVALINNLRSSISTYLAVENDKNQFQINNTIGNLVDDSDKNEQYFIDRQYYSDLSNRRSKSSDSRQRTPVKRCFICQKSGCWSSRHSAIEREKAKERYNKNFKRVAERQYDQFLVEFEGKSDYDDDNNDTEIKIQTLITDINKFEIPDSEAFITEVGTINLTEASKLITKLSDRSAVHALLRENDDIEDYQIMAPK